jgi:hypothetical protein
MVDAWLPTLLLGLISACVLVMTCVFVMTANDLRRVLRRVETLLPDCARAIREAQQALGTTRRLMARASRLARQVEGVVAQACEVAADTIGEVLDLRARARRFLAQWHGKNGARSGPRRLARD